MVWLFEFLFYFIFTKELIKLKIETTAENKSEGGAATQFTGRGREALKKILYQPNETQDWDYEG